MAALAISGVVFTAMLGRWQLGRAQQKLDWQAGVEARAAQALVDASWLLAHNNPAQALHRRARLTGTWMPQHTVFLENRQMQGKVGWFVLTPLRLRDSEYAVLVQRGWAARNFLQRSALPLIATPAGLVVVEGRVAPAPARLLDLGGPTGGPIRQNLDMVQLSKDIALPVLEFSLLQTDAAEDGLLRDWPVVAADADKHYGYAAQWFALSALIGMLYVWFQIVRPRMALRGTSDRG